MLTYLTKEIDLEAVQADILATLKQRHFEAEALQSRLLWKPYHVEMALHELIRAGRVVSFWTDSGRSQRKFYALAEAFDPGQPIVQLCTAADTADKLGEVNLIAYEPSRKP